MTRPLVMTVASSAWHARALRWLHAAASSLRASGQEGRAEVLEDGADRFTRWSSGEFCAILETARYSHRETAAALREVTGHGGVADKGRAIGMGDGAMIVMGPGAMGKRRG